MPEILYRDEHLAVLNKPADVSLLADRSGAPCLWDSLGDELGCKPYLVHRLDKGTSGVLLVALQPQTQRSLTRAFQQRRVGKFYLTWVTGAFDTGRSLTIDLPLRKGRKSRYRVAGERAHIVRAAGGWSLPTPTGDGHASLTRVRTLRAGQRRSLLLAAPLTGRTHQLRVHLAWIGARHSRRSPLRAPGCRAAAGTAAAVALPSSGGARLGDLQRHARARLAAGQRPAVTHSGRLRSIMKSTASASSSSVQLEHRPRAGMPGGIPSMVACTSASRPLARRASQAAGLPT
ncbi:MAG: RluA family pseudouridine synthase [Gammaproteobacteria bacterium]|nr:RluA family pseudouridine synthase [Gammaproteobacteria bacterium]